MVLERQLLFFAKYFLHFAQKGIILIFKIDFFVIGVISKNSLDYFFANISLIKVPKISSTELMLLMMSSRAGNRTINSLKVMLAPGEA